MTGQPAETHDVSLVIDFLNTLDIETRTDALATGSGWEEWAEDHGLRPDASGPAPLSLYPLNEVRSVRDSLRSLVGDPWALDFQPTVSIQVELSADGPVLTAASAVGTVLAAATRLSVLGQWNRIKICPARDCLWAFYDHSRNRSRTWCSMKVCGNRKKAREWRERAMTPYEPW